MQKSPSANTSRVASRELRRQQLINATIKCVARSGLSGVTMAEVTREASLSMGIVNLHFESKANLLIETLRYISDEYIGGWRRDVMETNTRPADKIRALIDYDFSTRVCNRNKLAVWFAYWGEAKSRPVYRRICAAHDRECNDAVTQICLLLAKTTGSRRNRGVMTADAEVVTTAYMSLVNGLWLNRLLSPKDISVTKAKRVCHSYFASQYPGQFSDTI